MVLRLRGSCPAARGRDRRRPQGGRRACPAGRGGRGPDRRRGRRDRRGGLGVGVGLRGRLPREARRHVLEPEGAAARAQGHAEGGEQSRADDPVEVDTERLLERLDELASHAGHLGDLEGPELQQGHDPLLEVGGPGQRAELGQGDPRLLPAGVIESQRIHHPRVHEQRRDLRPGVGAEGAPHEHPPAAQVVDLDRGRLRGRRGLEGPHDELLSGQVEREIEVPEQVHPEQHAHGGAELPRQPREILRHGRDVAHLDPVTEAERDPGRLGPVAGVEHRLRNLRRDHAERRLAVHLHGDDEGGAAGRWHLRDGEQAPRHREGPAAVAEASELRDLARPGVADVGIAEQRVELVRCTLDVPGVPEGATPHGVRLAARLPLDELERAVELQPRERDLPGEEPDLGLLGEQAQRVLDRRFRVLDVRHVVAGGRAVEPFLGERGPRRLPVRHGGAASHGEGEQRQERQAERWGRRSFQHGHLGVRGDVAGPRRASDRERPGRG